MDASFALDPRLAEGSLPVADWPLCHVRLKDDRRFPWLLLVPRRPGLVEITDLDPADSRALCEETLRATRLLVGLERPDKTNVATIGNVVAQLHVHVIGRWRSDPLWPDPVWGRGTAEPWDAAGLEARVARYRGAAGGS